MRTCYLLVLLGTMLAACASPSDGSSDAALLPLPQFRPGEAYRRPDVDFTRWTSLHVAAPRIRYDDGSRGDARYRKAEAFHLDEREQQILHEKLVQAIHDTWGEAPGWTLVDSPGPDTLVLQVELSDFYLYAPLRDDYAGISRTYTRESSRFTLQARLLTPGGELLLESRDRRVTGERGSGRLTRFSEVFYWGHIHRDFQRWARKLQPALLAS